MSDIPRTTGELAGDNPEGLTLTTAVTFLINNAKLYVTVVTFSINNNINFLEAIK